MTFIIRKSTVMIILGISDRLGASLGVRVYGAFFFNSGVFYMNDFHHRFGVFFCEFLVSYQRLGFIGGYFKEI